MRRRVMSDGRHARPVATYLRRRKSNLGQRNLRFHGMCNSLYGLSGRRTLEGRRSTECTLLAVTGDRTSTRRIANCRSHAQYLFESYTEILSLVVVPPFPNSWHGVTHHEPQCLILQFTLKILQFDNEAKPIPSVTTRCLITLCVRMREWRRERRHGGNVLAKNLRGCMPIVKSKSDRYVL